MTRRSIVRGALLALIMFLPLGASAAGIPAVTVSTAPGGGQQYSLTLQILLLMTAVTLLPGIVLMMTAFTRIVIVLAAVFASAWVVRRLKNFGRPGAGAIQIVADVALGTKERAVLLQVGAQQLLVGVAPGRVNTLHVLAEPVRTDDAQRGGGADELSPSSSPSPRPDFKSILKRSLGL